MLPFVLRLPLSLSKSLWKAGANCLLQSPCGCSISRCGYCTTNVKRQRQSADCPDGQPGVACSNYPTETKASLFPCTNDCSRQPYSTFAGSQRWVYIYRTSACTIALSGSISPKLG